jgi:hypothetical protein
MFVPWSVHVGFVVDKVALGQVFLRVLQFSTVSIIPPCPHTYIIWGINNGHVGGRRSDKIVSPYRHEQHQQHIISAHNGHCKYSPKCNKESNHLQRYKINTGLVVF